jgi:hypothetical protein
MTVIANAYGSGQHLYGSIIRAETSTSPIVLINTASIITADIAAYIAAISAVNALVIWRLCIETPVQVSRANQFQSPIDSTQNYVIQFLGQGSAVEQFFGNNQSQSFADFAFWTANYSGGYPNLPRVPAAPTPISDINYLPFGSKLADSFALYYQNAVPGSISFQLDYLAFLYSDPTEYFANVCGPVSYV